MRALVTVASRHGATQEIGDEVAQVLARAGHTVDLLRPDDVLDVREYGAVVLGSAVYAGRLLPSLRDLVHRCGAELGQTPVWVFWSGRVGAPLQPQEEPADVDRLLRAVRPRGCAAFAGRISIPGLGRTERALVRMLGVEPGDYRDFDDVRRWASGIADELSPHSAARSGEDRGAGDRCAVEPQLAGRG
jgi:menaquinone-dependent protoporphyrinogen oxidase